LVKEFPHIADQMKSIAKKRDKINKQAMEDVSLLLKTAKEITFEKNSNEETLKNSVDEKKINDLSVQEEEIAENPVNQTKLKDAVFKFKNKLNKNKIMPEPQTTELSLQKKNEGNDNSKTALKVDKDDESAQRKENNENDEKSQSESQSSSSSGNSENSEKNHGLFLLKLFFPSKKILNI